MSNLLAMLRRSCSYCKRASDYIRTILGNQANQKEQMVKLANCVENMHISVCQVLLKCMTIAQNREIKSKLIRNRLYVNYSLLVKTFMFFDRKSIIFMYTKDISIEE